MRHLRALIAAALRDTAVSLGRLFTAPSSTWDGSPPSLGETVTRARDLLDDARYLSGPDHGNPVSGNPGNPVSPGNPAGNPVSDGGKSGVRSSFLPEKMNLRREIRCQEIRCLSGNPVSDHHSCPKR